MKINLYNKFAEVFQTNPAKIGIIIGDPARIDILQKKGAELINCHCIYSLDQNGQSTLRTLSEQQSIFKSAETTAEEFTVILYTSDTPGKPEGAMITHGGLFNSGGLNIYPKEIELTIDSMMGVIESAVIGIPHPDFGEAVVAAVVKSETQENNDAFSENSVIDFIKQHHASYKVPKKVYFVAELPKNSLGKVQKNILRELFKQAFIY